MLFVCSPHHCAEPSIRIQLLELVSVAGSYCPEIGSPYGRWEGGRGHGTLNRACGLVSDWLGGRPRRRQCLCRPMFVPSVEAIGERIRVRRGAPGGWARGWAERTYLRSLF